MKKTKILMLFLVIGLIVGLFVGCIPTIPSSPSEIIDAENEYKNNNIVLGIPYYSAEGINNGCLCAAGAMIFGYYGFNVSPQELANYGLLMFPETTLNDEFGLFTELKRYAISNLNLKAKYGFLSIKKIKNKIDRGVPIIVLQYGKFPRIIENLHYRVIHGYNDTEQKFVASCAQGAYYDLSYSDFLHLNLIENVDKCPSIIIESNNLNVEADVDPKNGIPPHVVHCVGFASRGPIPYTYQWEFGDGNWSEKGTGIEHRNLFYTYLKSGKYTPILHVEDSGGSKSKCIAGVVTVEKKIPFIDGSVFANKQWIIDTDESPGSNLYSDSIENIWLDELGQLHFKMTRDKETKRWKCVEIYSDQQGWGYGKYEFEIEVVSDGEIDENVVIGLFTYDNSVTAHKSNNELDIEFSRWGNPEAESGNFVVWYDTTEGDEKRNLCTFSLQLAGNSSIHSFEWTNDNIIFDSSEITFCPLYPESFTYIERDNVIGPSGDGYGYIPIPNKERVYMNLWLHNGKPYNEDKMEKVELVIKDFKFTPISNNSPEIHSLIANPDSVEIGGNSTITCTASDPDGDALTYDWSSPDGGTISGSGSSVTWMAPGTAGMYPVICTVSDGKGGSDEASINIEVTDPSLGKPIKIFLQSGSSLNGISIDTSNPTISVSTGENISGTLQIEVQRPSGSPGNIVPVGYTTSWGPHSSSYIYVASSTPCGTKSYNVPINLTVPSTPGIYYLIFASRPEIGLGWVMSQTNWTMGSMHWDDGNDIADLIESELVGCLSTGYLILDMLENGVYKPTYYGIAYVKIIVSGVSSIPFKVFLQSGGTLNGNSINPSDPTLTVNTGGSISGTLKVQATYSGPSNNVVPLGYTPSWGSHSSSYVTVRSDLPVGTTTYNVPINLNAPTTTGTYFLIFATNAEMNLGWTMSRTNWTTGSMSWDDGKDIADVTEPELVDSLSTGYLILDMLEGSIYKSTQYGIAYVKIFVE